MDIIFLRGVELKTWLGVYEWEQQLPQTVLLDLEFALPDSAAAASDHLSDTVDYAQVVERLREVFSTQKFALIEALAEAIAELIFREFSIAYLKLSLTKQGILKGVANVGIQIERSKPS